MRAILSVENAGGDWRGADSALIIISGVVMAAKATYDTINGQILAETASGQTKNYVVDALGSVTGMSIWDVTLSHNPLHSWPDNN
jgi:hypothetical protein